MTMPKSLAATPQPTPPQGQTLVAQVREAIRTQISKGSYKPGDRLPSEARLTQEFGVSRTVIREAMALLKADGLITVRHGSGMFVAGDPRRRPLRIDPANITSVRDVIEIVQVRLGLEVEAAGLAAAARTPAQLRRIGGAVKAMAEAARRRKLATEEDRLFHTEIAAATGNPYFSVFLEFLGRYSIPRTKIQVGRGTDEERARYLAKLEAEHTAIYDAISARDPDAARIAMRRHLQNALQRLEQLQPEEIADVERLIEQQRQV